MAVSGLAMQRVLTYQDRSQLFHVAAFLQKQCTGTEQSQRNSEEREQYQPPANAKHVSELFRTVSTPEEGTIDAKQSTDAD